jgi:hypothetical protein
MRMHSMHSIENFSLFLDSILSPHDSFQISENSWLCGSFGRISSGSDVISLVTLQQQWPFSGRRNDRLKLTSSKPSTFKVENRTDDDDARARHAQKIRLIGPMNQSPKKVPEAVRLLLDDFSSLVCLPIKSA